MSHPVAEDAHLVQAAEGPGADAATLEELQRLIETSRSPTQVVAHHPLHEPATVHPQRYGGDFVTGQQMAEFAEVHVSGKARMQPGESPQEAQQLSPESVEFP